MLIFVFFVFFFNSFLVLVSVSHLIFGVVLGSKTKTCRGRFEFTSPMNRVIPGKFFLVRTLFFLSSKAEKCATADPRGGQE